MFRRSVFFASVVMLAMVLMGCSDDDGPRGDASLDAGVVDGAPGDGGQEVDAAPPCNKGEHRCEGQCVSNDSVEHCGDRCVPCPDPEHGSATCDGLVCGIECDQGYELCLGECIPEAEGPCGVNLPANEWVLLSTGDVGPRESPALVHFGQTGEYVLVGGLIPASVTPRPYDVQSLVLSEGTWKNRFPDGKDWGPEEGASQAPGFGTERFVFEDEEGNVRPNWGVSPTILAYRQYALLPNSNRVLFYLYNRTFSYDLSARTWTMHDPSEDPAGGVDRPRLLWGAMAADSSSDQVLLFGGGNVLDDDGGPGTWLYDPDSDAWASVEGAAPAERALPALAMDPDRHAYLLFGGDHLDRLLSDTWSFDAGTQTWQHFSPQRSPSPRGGAKLLFLPQSRRLVLIGGFGYASSTDYTASHYSMKPWEIWRFDWTGPRWDLVKHFDETDVQPAMQAKRNLAWSAAVGPGDVVVVHVKKGYGPEQKDCETWAIRIDPSVTDQGGTSTYGVMPDSEETRTGPYSPDWYEQGWPAVDEGAHAALLDSVPENQWTEIDVPNRPGMNRDWGTAAVDPVRGVIFRWSGGHVAHGGTDVLEYDIAENRFHLYYPPEMPLNFEYTNGLVPGQWTFEGRPFMSGHSYKTYTFSAVLDRMVLWKEPVVYIYDPDLHDFESERGSTDGGGNMYVTVLCATNDGVSAWTPDGLWDLDPVTKGFDPVTVTGDELPAMSADRNALVYDSTTDRLMLLSAVNGNSGQVWIYDRAGGVVATASPEGMNRLAAENVDFLREAVYLPSLNLLVLGTTFDRGDGTLLTPVLDVGENKWYGYEFGGQKDSHGVYNVSLGLVIDAQERIWGINSRSHIFLLKVDGDQAVREAL